MLIDFQKAFRRTKGSYLPNFTMVVKISFKMGAKEIHILCYFIAKS